MMMMEKKKEEKKIRNWLLPPYSYSGWNIDFDFDFDDDDDDSIRKFSDTNRQWVMDGCCQSYEWMFQTLLSNADTYVDVDTIYTILLLVIR